ncbi:MAG: hypothetical protein J6X58_06580 [Bacteroidales bacterium]|nr:hypothetical protein [Bacteroidales bacterium]
MVENHRSILFTKGDCRLAVLAFLVIVTSLASCVRAQSDYKETTGYLLKEIDPNVPYFYNRYRYGLIAQYYSEYYVVDEKTIEYFFNIDSVEYSRATMLCDPAIVMFADSATSRDVRRFTRIKDIISLDDSEIYAIGEKKYIIRKIRYAYYDNSQITVYIKGYNYYHAWDEISDEDTAMLNATYDVGELYGRNYYQCYHHLIEFLPTPSLISKHIWRRLYQLGEKNDK